MGNLRQGCAALSLLHAFTYTILFIPDESLTGSLSLSLLYEQGDKRDKLQKQKKLFVFKLPVRQNVHVVVVVVVMSTNPCSLRRSPL